MSRILLIEPRDILRQAISLALFPDHEVQLATLFSDSNELIALQFDLIIIDSAALSAPGNSDGEFLHKLRASKIPTIWIDDTRVGEAATHDKLVVLASPIQKDALQAAMTRCLDRSSVKSDAPASMPAKERMATKEARTAPEFQATGPQIIELVDVVAEPPERGKSRTRERRTR